MEKLDDICEWLGGLLRIEIIEIKKKKENLDMQLSSMMKNSLSGHIILLEKRKEMNFKDISTDIIWTET